MNRRPNQSRSNYDSFSRRHTQRFTASTPDEHFFETRKKRSLLLRAARLLPALLLITLAANFIVNQFVHVARVTIPVRGLTEEFDGYTLLHISDLKGASFGSDQGMLSFALGSAQYDAVVLTGDMVSQLGSAQPLYALIDQLSAHNPDAPIYFIAGDDDPEAVSTGHFDGGSPFAPWVLGAQQRGAQFLSGPQSVTRGEQTLWITTMQHLNLDVETMQGQYELQYIAALASGDENAVELATHNLQALQQTRDARAAMQPGDAVVTLAHVPPTPQELSGPLARANAVLCGHYLGGLIRLPGLGPVLIPSQNLPRYGILPGSGTHCGLRRDGNTYVYTSPGLGSDGDDYPGFFFRLFNPPTVTLVSLTPSAL